mmetsp:Transcript_14909/g.37779  ORF Transcript_14909/g.37779 Transcript_14909/m.37779 type:complete len:452 (+) Transcript_14909:663-2018(+)
MPATIVCASGRAGTRSGPESEGSSGRVRTCAEPALHSHTTSSTPTSGWPSLCTRSPSLCTLPAGRCPSSAHATEMTPLMRSNTLPAALASWSVMASRFCRCASCTTPSSTRQTESNVPSCPPRPPRMTGPATGSTHATSPSPRSSAERALPSASSAGQRSASATTIGVGVPSGLGAALASARAIAADALRRAWSDVQLASTTTSAERTWLPVRRATAASPLLRSAGVASASTTQTSAHSSNAARSSACVCSSCTKTAGSARPVVSTSTIEGGGPGGAAPSVGGSAGESAALTASRCLSRSPVGEQHTQPEPKSNISARNMSPVSRTGCASSPNSRARRWVMTAGTLPGGSSASSRFSKRVLPLPGAPVINRTWMGIAPSRCERSSDAAALTQRSPSPRATTAGTSALPTNSLTTCSTSPRPRSSWASRRSRTWRTASRPHPRSSLRASSPR